MPAYLNVVDIAGLVRGANEGKGLGNAFLSHVRAVDAMFEMVRIFESEEVTHVEGEVQSRLDCLLAFCFVLFSFRFVSVFFLFDYC